MILRISSHVSCLNNLTVIIGLFTLVMFSQEIAIAYQAVQVEDNRIHIETSTLKAVMDRGLLVSLIRKSDNCQLINSTADEKHALELIYSGGEAVSLGGEVGDSFNCIQINDNLARIYYPTEELLNQIEIGVKSFNKNSS